MNLKETATELKGNSALPEVLLNDEGPLESDRSVSPPALEEISADQHQVSPRASGEERVTSRRRVDLGWIKEFWPYRELFFFLAWRDIKIRYRQTALGAVWAVLQPLLTALVFTILFGRLGKVPSDGMPYALFSYTALLAWIYISGAVGAASGSLVGNAELVRKVYFPRATIPAASILAGLVDLAIGAVILALMMVHYRVRPGLNLLLWPALIFELVILTLGIGLILASLNVKYRDVKHALPFAIQLWLFLSPIIYPVSMIPKRFRIWLAFNPLTGIVEGLRASIVPTKPIDWNLIGISVAITLTLFWIGVVFFRKTERAFADVI